jgi:predicted MFS family arabinose efflux permease
VLGALTGNLNRRRLLIGAMALFAVANLLAYTASGYWSLMAASVALAFAAAVDVPGANALASLVVPPEPRGRAKAIAIVT